MDGQASVARKTNRLWTEAISMRAFKIGFLSIAFAWHWGPSGLGEDSGWPQFRGPGSRGVADHPGLPERWSETENVVWKQAIPGQGLSSPISVGDRIFLTTVTRSQGEPVAAKAGLYFGGEQRAAPPVEHLWRVLCLDLLSGVVLWDQTLHQGVPPQPRHIKNSYASETPVTDGEFVYVAFGDVGLYCLTLDGKLVWAKDLPSPPTRLGWGPAASPVVEGDRLFYVSDNDEASFLLALDKRTGNEIFKISRDEKTNWSTPSIWKNSLRTELIVPGSNKVRSYDLDGKQLYEFGGCSSITIATPYAVGDMLYVSSGYVLDLKRPIYAVRPGASGDISLADDETSNNWIVWCQKQGAPYNPTTLTYKGILYALYDRAIVATFDARTGQKKLERERIPKGRTFTASPWAGNDRIYFLSEFGETFVYSAGEKCELLHTNRLSEDEALYMATPAIIGDRLLIRSSSSLYCVGKR